MTQRMPLIVLAGSSPRRGPIPRGMTAEDMLGQFKGAVPLPDGKLLVREVIERFMAAGRFESPVLVGPRRIYEEAAVGCEVVDAEGTLATTLERTVQTIRSRFAVTTPIAITTCDILPTPEEIQTLLATGYDPVSACMFWGQMVRATPEQMGASAWKPIYPFRGPDGNRLTLYPGHVVILRPEGLRFEVTIRLLHLAYTYRNTPLARRMVGLLARSLGTLIGQDARNLGRWQSPVLSVAIPFHGLRAYLSHVQGQLTVGAFEQAFTKIFVHRDFQGTANGRPTVFALTDTLSFAKDMDTKAELQEAVRQLSCDSA